MPPEKKIILTCKNVILQIYTVKTTTYNITKYYNTTASRYSGQCLSKIHSLLPILPSCTKVLQFLLQGFTGSSHSFGWLLTHGFHHYSCLVSLVIVFLPLLVY